MVVALLSSLVWFAIVSLLLYSLIPVYRIHCKNGLKHPLTLPLIGSNLSLFKHGIQYTYVKWASLYGQIFNYMEGPKRVIVITDPNEIKEILVKNFSAFPNRRGPIFLGKLLKKSVFMAKDKEWRDLRKTLIPTFTTYKMKSVMFPLMYKCSIQTLKHFRDKIASSGQNKVTIDVKALFGCLTMDVISSTAFGLDLDSYQETNHEFVMQAKKVFDLRINSPLFIFWIMFPYILPVLNFLNLSMTDPGVYNFFAKVIEKTVEERKSRHIHRPDYLQLLIDSAVDEDVKISEEEQNNSHSEKSNKCPHDLATVGADGSNEKIVNGTCPIKLDQDDGGIIEDQHNSTLDTYVMKEDSPKTQDSNSSPHKDDDKIIKGLTKEQFVANALLFFIAGYETTANALCWITNTLGWHPEVQERLRAEIQTMWSRKNGNKKLDYGSSKPELTYDDVIGLKYLDQVVKEVLRLYPPVLLLDRITGEDFTLEAGTQVKKGTLIQIPVMAVHRDPNVWPEPNEFKPERFENENKDNQYSYIPFGSGPRNCIGLRFALLEIKLTLIILFLAGLKFSPSEGDIKDKTPYNIEYRKNGINFPAHGLKVDCEII